MEYRQMIILYRSRHPSLKVVDDMLVKKEIPFQHVGKNFRNKKMLLTEYIVATMKLVADHENDIILSALLSALAERFDLGKDFDLYDAYHNTLQGVTLEKLLNITELIAEIDLQDDSNHIDQLTNKVGVSAFHTAKGLEYKSGLYHCS